MPRNRGMRFSLFALFLVAPLSAESEGRSPRRISVDLVGVSTEDVFRSLADELEIPLNFDPELAGTINLRLENVRVRTALDAACDSIGCTYVVVEGGKARLNVYPSHTEESRGRGLVTDSLITDRTLMPVGMSLRDAKLGDVMSTLAKILRCELKMEVDPSAKLTIELENVTAMQALGRIGDLMKVDTTLIPWQPLIDDCVMKVTPTQGR